MRRVYHCVLLVAVVLACVQAIGCGGGGASTMPQVSTTSLPNGTVASPYSATLTAIGGTSPYTWTQSSGGAMPGGVSLGSAGIFAGTPTAAGTFGPYVFQVKDSTGLVASSPSMSITITAGTLAVTTTTLPAAVVNAPYSVTLGASGGTPPYTWTETSGGALPPGLTNVTSGGVIAGTPTVTGTYGPYGFRVTDAANGTAVTGSLSLTVGAATCAPLGNEAALNAGTPYAFLLKGTDGSGNPIDMAGSFTPNGAGGITAATVDYNGFTNGPAQMQVNVGASSYSFGTSTLGCLALSFSGSVPGPATTPNKGTTAKLAHGSAMRSQEASAAAAAGAAVVSVQFAFSLDGFDGTVYHTGRIIESDSVGTNAAGFLHLQVPSTFAVTSLLSNYAFGFDGWTAAASGNARTAVAGSLTNTAGTLTAGYADLNVGGVASGELTGGSGTLNAAIDATTGRGTGTYTIATSGGNVTFDLAFYILNASDFIVLSTDNPAAVGNAPLLGGRALASNATDAQSSLSGYYVLAAEGLQSSGSSAANLAEIATLNADGAGNIPSAILYMNNAGSYSHPSFLNNSYTVEAASGRVSIAGITATPPMIYLTAGNTADGGVAGFLVGTDREASSGILVSQSTTAPSFTLGDITGSYATSTEEDIAGKSGTMVGTFSFTGGGQYVATVKSTGTVPSLPGLGSIVVSSDGSGSLNGGNFPLVTNGKAIFAIPNSGNPLLYVFTGGASLD